MSVAIDNFKYHITKCEEAIEIYKYLNKEKRYSADFGLRYAWVAAVSALDHYITELIIEKSVEQFANDLPLTKKILNEGIPLEIVLKIKKANEFQAILEFKYAITNIVRYKTYQKPDDIADGLSFIWSERRKWKKISKLLGIKPEKSREILNSIANRRDIIVHNADFNNKDRCLYECSLTETNEAIEYIKKTVFAIDHIIENDNI